MHDENDILETHVEEFTPPVPEDASLDTSLDASLDTANQRDASPPPQNLCDLRLQRIDDYLNTSLSSPLAEVAMLGGLNVDLAVIELRLSQSIEAAMAECESTREYLDAVPGGVEKLLKLSRQIERGTRLANDLARNYSKADPILRLPKIVQLP